MKKTKRALVLVATCGMLLQFGGCLDLTLKNIPIGFGRSLGELPATWVSQNFLTDLFG